MTTKTTRIGELFEICLFVATAVLCTTPFVTLIANRAATLVA